MTNDLGIIPEHMAHLPGNPFTQTQVDAALAAVRRAAGWHIAPAVTETIELDVRPCWSHLQLPTLELVAVVEIRDANTAEVIPATEYRVSRKLCTIKRDRAWPVGYETVSVDFTHGHSELPDELLQVLADAARMATRDQGIRSVSIDDFQQSFGTSASVTSNPLGNSTILDAYSLSGGRSLHGFGIA